jgi:hypothetical protein
MPQGLTWYEVDLTTYLVWVLEKARLIWNVRWTAPVRTIATAGHEVAGPGGAPVMPIGEAAPQLS